jgi:hypothetical protein
MIEERTVAAVSRPPTAAVRDALDGTPDAIDREDGSYYAPAWLVATTHWLRVASASRVLVYVVFTILYLIPTVLLCRMKLFWDDEFFTLYLSRANWSSLLQALATGADQHPPPFYYLTHWITQLLGTSHLSLRLQAVVGFWVFCICMYEVGRQLITPMWGVVAMLFPLSTKLYYYASEARGYGLVTGFTALALLSWLRVTENRHRRVYLALLGLSLMGAVSSHYYAAVAVASLAAGEIVRSKVRRTIDVPVWLAFGCTFVPILAFLPTIRSAHQYASHFWAIPIWSDAVSFYPTELGMGIFPLLGLLVAGISFGVNLTGWRSPNGDDPHRPEALNAWQMTALYYLSLTPFFTMLMAKLVTHGYASRYAISAVVGVSMLAVYFVSRLSPRALTAFAAAMVCLVMFGLQVRLLRARFATERTTVLNNVNLLGTTGNEQIVVMDMTLMHQLTFYSPRELATRVTYVADPTESIRYLHQDTMDHGLLDLRRWFPLKAIPLAMFLSDTPHYLTYGSENDWSWFTYDLPRIGDATLVAREPDDRLMFSVTSRHPPLDPTVVAKERTSAADMLYLREPMTGPSLCDLWMGDAHCILTMK